MQEKGIIPMTDYDFHQHHRQGVLKIGTAGGWVRASTGYSFQYAGRKVEQILENMKANRPLTSKLRPLKYTIYDRLFLDVLFNDNDLGPTLFHSMYHKNPIQRIFRFLDGTTNLWTDFKIIVSFPSMPFMKAIIRQISGMRRKVKPISDP
jgi:lycopene beta-cyclase